MSEYHVTQDDNGLRLDKWCKKHLPGIPFGLTQKLIRKGAIRVNARKVATSHRLEGGEAITVPPSVTDPQRRGTPPRFSQVGDAELEALRSCIIHEDEHCVALNKPAGLAVQGGSGVHDSVDARLQYLAEQTGERLRLTHRLDKDTSGILLLGKSRTDAANLTDAFRSKSARKCYWALVVGMPAQPWGDIALPLGKRFYQGREKMAVVVDASQGKEARSQYRVVATTPDESLSWVELRPITGRTHQLRVHMAALGCPIFGDGKYGGADAFPAAGAMLDQQLHLHSRYLDLSDADHPLQIHAPLSAHMRQSWQALGFPETDQGVSLLEI